MTPAATPCARPAATSTVDGSTYHIPTARECDQCHQGRKDRILGFEAIGLGVAGAEGLTLEKLIDQKLIDHAPARATCRSPTTAPARAPRSSAGST